MSLLNSGIKIRSAKSDGYTKYIIEYPRKKGVPVNISLGILKNIIRESNVIIHIDSVLSFLGTNTSKTQIKQLRNLLRDEGIYFDFRAAKLGGRGGLAGFLLGRKPESQEIVTFALKKGFDDERILKLILDIGCKVYIPITDNPNDELVSKVFNGHFEDDDERFDVFKYLIYINNVIDQAAVDTRELTLSDVENICKNL